MRRPSFFWIVLILVVWWVLVDPRPGAWIAGLIALAAGIGLHLALGGRKDTKVQVGGLATFVPYFLWQSVKGGWDVSRRALTPTLPLNPDLLTYSLSLPPGPPRVFLTNALSLLPGTFGADLRGDDLIVHLLVGGPGAEGRVRELEERVARVFGVDAS